MKQTIIQPTPKAEAPAGEPKKPDPEEESEAKKPKAEAEDPEEGEEGKPDDEKKEDEDGTGAKASAALEARVAALEAVSKETLEAVRAIQKAMLPGAGEETRGDHAADRGCAPKAAAPGRQGDALAKALAMPEGMERAAYVNAHAEEILRAAIAARDAR